jgi:NAD(P)H dehydrogenase (quinone)
MKVGIIVHSKTGNSMHVASKIKEALMASGCMADICRVEATNDSESNPSAIQLVSRPDISSYDVLILGAPVRGGRLSPVMDAYLQTLPSVHDKIAFGFVTHFFPNESMGGTQAIRRMDEICNAKGIELENTSIVSWMNPFKRVKSIQNTVDASKAIIINACD